MQTPKEQLESWKTYNFILIQILLKCKENNAEPILKNPQICFMPASYYKVLVRRANNMACYFMIQQMLLIYFSFLNTYQVHRKSIWSKNGPN